MQGRVKTVSNGDKNQQMPLWPGDRKEEGGRGLWGQKALALSPLLFSPMVSGSGLQNCLTNQAGNAIVRTVRCQVTGEGVAISN